MNTAFSQTCLEFSFLLEKATTIPTNCPPHPEVWNLVVSGTKIDLPCREPKSWARWREYLEYLDGSFHGLSAFRVEKQDQMVCVRVRAHVCTHKHAHAYIGSIYVYI